MEYKSNDLNNLDMMKYYYHVYEKHRTVRPYPIKFNKKINIVEIYEGGSDLPNGVNYDDYDRFMKMIKSMK